MKLVPAKAQDIDWIMQLEEAPENRDFVWQGSYEEHLSEIDEENCYLFIHEDDEGNKLGYSLNRFNTRAKSLEIRRIVIDIKGCGHGKKAMQSLFDFGFLELGAQRIWLDVYPHNEVGISLYKSLGLTQEAHLRRSDFQCGKYCDQIIFGLLKEEYES